MYVTSYLRSSESFLKDLNRTESSFQKYHEFMNNNNLYEKEFFGEKLENQLIELEKEGYSIINITESNHKSLSLRQEIK